MFRHSGSSSSQGPEDPELRHHHYHRDHQSGASSLSNLMSLQSKGEFVWGSKPVLARRGHVSPGAPVAHAPMLAAGRIAKVVDVIRNPKSTFYRMKKKFAELDKVIDDDSVLHWFRFMLHFCSCGQTNEVDATRKIIVWFNGITSFVHLVMAIVFISLCASNGNFSLNFSLKRDAVLVNSAPGLPPLGGALIGNMTSAVARDEIAGFPFFGGCLRNSSYYAKPNELRWRRDNETALITYTYARAIPGAWLNLPSLVIAFFLLSFAFQAGIIFLDKCSAWPTYSIMFPKSGSKVSPETGAGGAPVSRARRFLTFNFLRYIEYSFSASVMIVTISLFAGIVDQVRLSARGAASVMCRS